MNPRFLLVGAFAIASAFVIDNASAQGSATGAGATMGTQQGTTAATTTNTMPARSNRGGKVRGQARAKQVHKMNAAKRRVKTTR